MDKIPDFAKTVRAFEAGKGEPFPACHVGHRIRCCFMEADGDEQVAVSIWCADCDTEFFVQHFETPEEHKLLREAALAGGWEQRGSSVTDWEGAGYDD